MSHPVDHSRRRRLERVERTLEAQKAFIHRVPDPDTRERAEANLMALVEMRDRLKEAA